MPNLSLEFSFQEMDSQQSLSRLALSVGSSLINNTITIPLDNGKGVIKKICMEDGLTMRIWDIQLHHSLIIKKTADIQSSDRVFHLAFLLNPEVLSVKATNSDKKFTLPEGRNILFVSNDIDAEAELITTAGLRAIDISFTASWLMRSFADADEKLLEFIQEILKSNKPTLFFESTTAEEFRLLSSLHTIGLSSTKDSLWVKAGALSLLSGFYNKVASKCFAELQDYRLHYQEKMLEVEKLLKSSLEKKFPGIDIIAKKMMMGESTLKRHFKLMFGKTIQEHYLELKMDYAKRIMLDQPLSVNQVATLLDYEKPSNFILTFKRFHGISPGALRRKFG